MKIKSIKIVNYKSYGEVDNILYLNDINTIIGKNESGKSNLIEAFCAIDYKGISESFFKQYNRKSGGSVELSISIVSNEILESILTFKSDTLIEISGGISKYILEDKQFQTVLKSIEEQKLNRPFNGDLMNNNYTSLVKDLLACDTKIVLYDQRALRDICNSLGKVEKYKNHVDNIMFCIRYLEDLYQKFPKIIKISNVQLHTSYSKDSLINEKDDKLILEQFLNCIGYSLDEIKRYWSLPTQSEQEDFSELLKDKVQDFMNEFNSFYSQDKVELIPTIENEIVK